MPGFKLHIDEHPSLHAAAFVTTFRVPLEELATPPSVLALLNVAAAAPLQRQENVRSAVRDMLRHGGYKPTGRGKPASEHLVRAASVSQPGLRIGPRQVLTVSRYTVIITKCAPIPPLSIFPNSSLAQA